MQTSKFRVRSRKLRRIAEFVSNTFECRSLLSSRYVTFLQETQGNPYSFLIISAICSTLYYTLFFLISSFCFLHAFLAGVVEYLIQYILSRGLEW